jgi:hypothetical protein
VTDSSQENPENLCREGAECTLWVRDTLSDRKYQGSYQPIVQNIAQAMSETLQQAKNDERIAPPLRSAISTAWEAGLESNLVK